MLKNKKMLVSQHTHTHTVKTSALFVASCHRDCRNILF